MISEGTYKARATSANDVQFGFSKNGNEQIAVLFDLLDEHGSPTGDRITWIGFFTDKTRERTIESLRHCGWAGDDFADLSGIESAEVDLVVKHEEYEGKTQAKVAFVNRAGAGGKIKFNNAMTADQRAEFGRRMRGELMASASKAAPANRTTPGGSRVPQGTAAQGFGRTGTDEDIPF